MTWVINVVMILVTCRYKLLYFPL